MAVDYDSWKLASPYDDYSPSPSDEGYVHEDDLPNFDDTRDFLSGIVESLYKTGNVESLEHCLEELCAQYDVEFEPKVPQLETKNKNRLMHWYLGYQRATIENMNSTRR